MDFFRKLLGISPKIDWDEVRRTLEPKLAGIKQPTVRLIKCLEKTRCYLGGRPFVESASFQWPMSNGQPMTFLAQLDLAEIASAHKYDYLDDEGQLLFFYDIVSMPWGFDPNDRGQWQVIYQTRPEQYADFPAGMDDDLRIKQHYVKPARIEIFPNYDDPVIEALGLSDAETDVYIDISDTEQQPKHQVGGLPTPVQGNHMELESQLASNGVYVGNPKGYASAEAKRLEAGAVNWKLLFQFDSDDDLDVMWGDCGMLYFWVEQEKARRNEFENSWLILQCS